MKDEMKKQNGRGRVQIGTSSLLLIFTVLCLIIFSVLSLSSAEADHKLAVKNELYVSAYYEADGEAEEMLRHIDRILLSAAEDSRTDGSGEAGFAARLQEEYGDGYSQGVISCQVTINEQQYLLIELLVKPYEQIRSGERSFAVKTWVAQNKEDYEIETDMPVWNGDWSGE